MLQIKNYHKGGHTGTAPDWSPALRLRPRELADDGRRLEVDNVTIDNTTNADPLKIDAAYEVAKGRVVQVSEIVVNRLTVRGVRRTAEAANWINPKTKKKDPPHCDGFQIRNMGPKLCPVTIKDSVIDTQGECDGGMIEGAVSVLLDGVTTKRGSIKIKPGGHKAGPVRIVNSDASVILYPGITDVAWDGWAPAPRADGGARFVTQRLDPKPKPCPACNGTGLVPFVLLLVLLLLAGGCASSRDSGRVVVADAAAPVGTSIARAEARVESARENVIAAKPETSKAGLGRLDSADQQLLKTLADLSDANAALEGARAQARALSADNQALRDERERERAEHARELAALKAEHRRELQTQKTTGDNRYALLEGEWYVRWGRTIETWLWRLKWLAIGYVLLWLGLSVGSLFVKGPIGAAMSMVSAFLNPGEWVRVIRDNLFFRGKVRASPSRSSP